MTTTMRPTVVVLAPEALALRLVREWQAGHLLARPRQLGQLADGRIKAALVLAEGCRCGAPAAPAGGRNAAYGHGRTTAGAAVRSRRRWPPARLLWPAVGLLLVGAGGYGLGTTVVGERVLEVANAAAGVLVAVCVVVLLAAARRRRR